MARFRIMGRGYNNCKNF